MTNSDTTTHDDKRQDGKQNDKWPDTQPAADFDTSILDDIDLGIPNGVTLYRPHYPVNERMHADALEPFKIIARGRHPWHKQTRSKAVLQLFNQANKPFGSDRRQIGPSRNILILEYRKIRTRSIRISGAVFWDGA